MLMTCVTRDRERLVQVRLKPTRSSGSLWWQSFDACIKTAVQKFQNDNNCKVFLMTLKTGGLGLNLTAADDIFIFDPWWNKAAGNPAIDCAYRLGQDGQDRLIGHHDTGNLFLTLNPEP